MRRILMSALLVAVAVVLQLTTINGLRLPGGGVPDLVLVVVAALGLAGGPLTGAVTGFAAGLCLDLAPPGSGVIGEYALVLCLVGWACGRLRGTLTRSALLPIGIAAAAAVLGEIMVAALGLALQPAQVSWASVRLVLPATLFYDIAISPFVLYLVLLATARLDQDPAASAAASAGRARLRRVDRASPQSGSLAGAARSGRAGLAGPAGAAGGAVLLGRGGWLAGPPQSRRERKAAAGRGLRLGRGRAGDGWIGDSAAARRALGGQLSRQALSGQAHRGQVFGGQAFSGQSPGRPHGSGAARLRSGVAGSAAGGQAPRTLAARPVNLRLASGRKRDGVVGNMLGGGRPVLLGGQPSMARLGKRRTRGFRPSAMPGGSALGGQSRSGHLAAQVPIRFSTGRFSTRRSGARRWRWGRAGTGGLGAARGARIGSVRRRDGVVGGGVLTTIGGTGRRPAAPRFRIKPGTALSGGAGTQPLAGLRYPARRPPSRLRMHGRRGDGVVGSTLTGGRGAGRFRPVPGRAGPTRPATPRFRARPLAGSAPMNGKRPQFGYRRWSVLSLLTRRRGGAARSGPPRMWRVGRRTGGRR